jgi:hypothetical protein
MGQMLRSDFPGLELEHFPRQLRPQRYFCHSHACYPVYLTPNSGATLTIALSNLGRIFGGFIEQQWLGSSRNNNLPAGQAFLFR